jgi:hypothetical protein
MVSSESDPDPKPADITGVGPTKVNEEKSL